MEAIKLLVAVSAAVAVRAGSVRAGEGTVTLSPEHLSALTADERAQLAELLDEVKATGYPGAFGLRARKAALGMTAATALALPSPDTSVSAVVEALRTRLAEESAEHERLLAEESVELAGVVKRALAASPAERSGYDPGDRWVFHWDDNARIDRAVARGIPGAAEAKEHLRATYAEVARRNSADLVAEAERYCALPLERRMRQDDKGDWDAVPPIGFRHANAVEMRLGPEAAKAFQEAHDAATARTTTERAQRAEAERRAKEALVAFALTVPELAPAAREGYDVRKGVADEIARRVASVPAPNSPLGGFLDAETYAQGGRGWGPLEWEDAPSPNAALLALRSSIVAHVATVERPEGVTITVERVARVVTEDTDGNTDYTGNPTTRKRRGVVVVIDGPTLPQRVVVFPGE